MVLVDSSSWIHLLRPHGDSTVRARVEAILIAGEACWCPVVRLELWNGAGGAREKKVLRDLEQTLIELPISAAVWDGACELARKARAAGLSIPATDLMIAACARHHAARLEHADSDFDMLREII